MLLFTFNLRLRACTSETVGEGIKLLTGELQRLASDIPRVSEQMLLLLGARCNPGLLNGLPMLPPTPSTSIARPTRTTNKLREP